MPDLILKVTQGPTGQSTAKVTRTEGVRGSVGVSNAVIITGAGSPTAEVGEDGSFYIDYLAMAIFGPKAGGAWPNGAYLIGAGGGPVELGGLGIDYIIRDPNAPTPYDFVIS